MADKTNVLSDTNLNPPTSRMRLSAITLPSLKINSGQIYEEARRELRYPKCIPIYKEMSLEPTIASATSLIEILISRASWEVKAPKDAPQEEKDRAEFINYCLENMERDWSEYIIEMLGYITWGFQCAEKIYTKVEKGEYKGKLALSDLRFVSPETISKWLYFVDSGKLAGFRQDFSRISSDFSTARTLADKNGAYRDIPRKKFLLFRYNTKLDNPQGNSPLKSCYIPWKHKVTAEDLELIALQRNYGGIPKLGVDVDFLAKASDEDSNEYTVLQEMKRQAASFTAGDQAYVMMPIAYTDSGKELFTYDLLKSDGGSGDNSDTIIVRNENKMLMSFLADVLKLGTESHGSYALADSKTNLLAMGIEHHLALIKGVLNKDLVRQIYALNGWDYNSKTSAKFVYGDLEKPDLEALGKYIQRVVSVGAVRANKELERKLLDDVGIETSDNEELDLIPTQNNSRAGESDGTSGTGDSQSGGSNSDNNADNAD